ncbi:MAG: hypothetical protein NUV77_07700 [Thermoguttaceae bacterium]|jgi:hypothetical protein|nr:hypothetical protein [Thermoguttaceae bacterium]
MKHIATVLVLIAGCLVPGCRKSTTYKAEDGTRATVTERGKNTEVTIEGKDGAKVRLSSGGNVALPEGFPKDVPIYPGSTVTLSVSTKDGAQVGLKTADPRAKVAEFYKAQLKSQGWEIETTLDSDQGAMLAGKKGKNTVAAMVNSDSEGTMIIPRAVP